MFHELALYDKSDFIVTQPLSWQQHNKTISYPMFQPKQQHTQKEKCTKNI